MKGKKRPAVEYQIRASKRKKGKNSKFTFIPHKITPMSPTESNKKKKR